MNESFTLRGVTFRNRVLTASGTFGYGDETPDLADVSMFGGIITKSLSLKPRDGNAPPRITETASGMLNSIGLANIGVQRFIDDKIPVLRACGTNIIANIAASSVDEYCAVAERLEPFAEIAGYEINVSCPNVKEGGLNFGTDPKQVALITREVRRRTGKILIIKLTPNVTHIGEFARACEAEGADAVSAVNTLIGMAVNIHTRKPRLSSTTGGLSGPAIKPVALAKVYELTRSVTIPVIGIGGIASWEDAVEFLLVGATAVQVGTQNFIAPSAAAMIAAGIREYCVMHGYDDAAEVVGSLIVEKNRSVVDGWL